MTEQENAKAVEVRTPRSHHATQAKKTVRKHRAKATNAVAHEPRKRRDPYARAFDAAQKRLAKATEEREKLRRQLVAIDAEIPFLERVIRTFAPAPNANQKEQKEQTPTEIIPGGIVPPHLEHFFRPREEEERVAVFSGVPAGLTADALTEDDTLHDPLSESGEEILS